MRTFCNEGHSPYLNYSGATKSRGRGKIHWTVDPTKVNVILYKLQLNTPSGTCIVMHQNLAGHLTERGHTRTEKIDTPLYN